MFRSLILDLNAVVPACGAHASGMFILLNSRFSDKTSPAEFIYLLHVMHGALAPNI